MVQHHDTDPKKLPTLGRLFLWVDKPGSVTKIIWVLAAASAFVFLIDFTYSKHPSFEIENFPGAHGLFGFLSFTFIILAVRVLRRILGRPEDYYGDKAVDREAYPEDQTDKVTHDGL